MRTVFLKSSKIDWDEILHLLHEEKTIKLYFSTQEVFVICNISGILIFQNGVKEGYETSLYDVEAHKVSIYNPGFDVEQFKEVIECYSFGGDLNNIIKIESFDFKVKLID